MASDTIEVVILARDEASKTLGGIRGALGGLGGAVGTVAKVGTATFLGVGAAAVGGFGLALRESINMNAQLEQSTMMFTTLMGDADLAKEHVAGLFEFAAATPFETGEIIAASKHLQVFGGAALNTQENLTLIGDAAAAVGAPFDEVAFWTGRMYSAIQGGQPFGEAAMRLQELGLMSPGVRTEMEAMQEAGAGAGEVWGAFAGQMGTFTGAMEMQSQSWTGLTSTIKDNIQMMMADALLPFFEAAKTGLSALATWLSSPEIQAGIQAFAEKMGVLVTNFVNFLINGVVPFVQQYGPGFVNVLTGIGTALAVFTVIGGVITKFLALKAAIAAASAAIATAGGGISGIIAIIGGPLTIAIAAIAAVVGLFAVAWKNNWGDIQGKVSAAWAVIQPVLAQIVEWVSGKVTAGLEALRAFWVDTAWPAIQSAVAVAWPIIQSIFTAIGEFITGTLIPTIQALYTKWVEDVWPTIQTITENVWTVIEAIFTEIGRWINDNIMPWVEALRALWVDEVWPAIQSALETAWGVIEPIWIAFKDWLDVVLPPIIEGLKTIFETAMEGIKNAIQPVKDVWDALVGAVQSFWNWITGKEFTFKINLPDLPDWAIPGSPLPIHTRWKEFAEAMPAIGQRIADALMAAFSGLADPIEQIDKIIGAANNLAGLAGNFESIFSQQTIAPIESHLEGIGARLDEIGDPLTRLMDELGIGINQPAANALLQQIADTNPVGSQERANAIVALALLEERQRLLLQQAQVQSQLEAQQGRLLRLEIQRQQLGFLQEQFNLIKLINENGLDPSIMDGLTFGLDADPAALMDAMVAAMQTMLTNAETQLIGAGTPVDRSLAGEFFRGAGGGDNRTMVVNIDARQAGRGVEADIRRVVKSVMDEYGVRADIRLRTS